MDNTIKVYAAGGWFNKSDDNIQTMLENFYDGYKKVDGYYPRKHGVKLSSGEFHDPNLRKKVFMDNIKHIDTADIVIANLDGSNGQDTGTCYEVGYAMARGIPVIAFMLEGNKFDETMRAIKDGFFAICVGLDDLKRTLDLINPESFSNAENIEYTYTGGDKVLYVSPDNSDKIIKDSIDTANVIMEGYGKDMRWMDKITTNEIFNCIEAAFTDVGFMVGVIDDRHPIVSWMFGQCFARHIPIISFTNYDWDVNIMLLCSILQHVKGNDKLREVLQEVKRYGIDSLEPFDSSNIKAY